MRHRIGVAALTDVGCKRGNNEDSFGYDQAAGIYVVSDGMGGSAAGEVASNVAVGATMSHYSRMRQSQAGTSHSAQDLLYFAIVQANEAVYTMSRHDPRLSGMGATLLAICLENTHAIVANLGDSRAYLLRGEAFYQVTEDHSLAAEQTRSGILAVDLLDRPGANVITRAVGTQPTVDPDLFELDLAAGDRVLLATDGLMKHMSDPEIMKIVSAAQTILEACELLIRTVKRRGALDNVTCLLLEVEAAS